MQNLHRQFGLGAVEAAKKRQRKLHRLHSHSVASQGGGGVSLSRPYLQSSKLKRTARQPNKLLVLSDAKDPMWSRFSEELKTAKYAKPNADGLKPKPKKPHLEKISMVVAGSPLLAPLAQFLGSLFQMRPQFEEHGQQAGVDLAD
jgi:hypothetical protein